MCAAKNLYMPASVKQWLDADIVWNSLKSILFPEARGLFLAGEGIEGVDLNWQVQFTNELSWVSWYLFRAIIVNIRVQFNTKAITTPKLAWAVLTQLKSLQINIKVFITPILFRDSHVACVGYEDIIKAAIYKTLLTPMVSAVLTKNRGSLKVQRSLVNSRTMGQETL